MHCGQRGHRVSLRSVRRRRSLRMLLRLQLSHRDNLRFSNGRVRVIVPGAVFDCAMNAVFDAMNSVCSAMVAFLASVAVFLSARHPFTPTMNITLATYEHVPDAHDHVDGDHDRVLRRKGRARGRHEPRP